MFSNNVKIILMGKLFIKFHNYLVSTKNIVGLLDYFLIWVSEKFILLRFKVIVNALINNILFHKQIYKSGESKQFYIKAILRL